MVVDNKKKQGRTGPLEFVTIRDEYSQDGRVSIVDESDIVYREFGSRLTRQAGTLQGNSRSTPREATLALDVDETLLFRFSALTYNAHRIHYDYNWAREEGYRGLVVHGPLQALMMGELIRRNGDGLVGKQFSYRLVSPMVGPQKFTASAGNNDVKKSLEICDMDGCVTAVSTVGLIEPGEK